MKPTLINAVRQKEIDLVKQILDEGTTTIEERDEALLKAYDSTIIELILQKGTTIEARDKALFNNSPRVFQPENVKVILEEGTSIMGRSKALIEASIGWYISPTIITYILEKGTHLEDQHKALQEVYKTIKERDSFNMPRLSNLFEAADILKQAID